MKYIKYMIGSLIISFGILLVVVAVLSSFQGEAPENIVRYLGVAWIVLAIAILPWAKKIIRV